MRRGGQYTFRAEYKGYTVRCSFFRAVPEFTCDVLKEKRGLDANDQYLADKVYTDLDAITAAIDRYDLSLRKNFSNHTAYRVKGGYRDDPKRIEKVEITSIIDEKMCWIKNSDGNREQDRLEDLYGDRDQLQAYCVRCNAALKEYKAAEEIAEKIVKEYRWLPMP